MSKLLLATVWVLLPALAWVQAVASLDVKHHRATVLLPLSPSRRG